MCVCWGNGNATHLLLLNPLKEEKKASREVMDGMEMRLVQLQ